MPTETANDLCPACDRQVPGNAPGGLCPFCLLQTVLSDASIESSGNAEGIDSTICDNSNTPHPNGLTVDFSGSRIDDFPPVEVSTRYFGDYELQEEIASGGMGVVYRARQVRLNRIVALKMIRAGKFSSWTEIKRLRTEAEAGSTA
jgi:hypothetical protein